MNTKHLLLATGTIIMLVIYGCKKDDHPPGSGPEKLCRIKEVLNSDSLGWNTFALDFTYDSNGNLVRIRPRYLAPYNDYEIRYDSLNRATDIILFYLRRYNVYGEPFNYWLRPKYDAKNRIIADSSFSGGIIGDDPMNQPPDYIVYARKRVYTYDAQDRIVKALESYVDFGMTYFVDTRYFYNSKTNNLDSLVQWSSNNSHRYRAIFSGYDNKVNIRRTNPLLQYLDRNYSRNNNFTTTEYNEYNLPTKLNANPTGSSFLSYTLNATSIKYTCTEPAKNALK